MLLAQLHGWWAARSGLVAIWCGRAVMPRLLAAGGELMCRQGLQQDLFSLAPTKRGSLLPSTIEWQGASAQADCLSVGQAALQHLSSGKTQHSAAACPYTACASERMPARPCSLSEPQQSSVSSPLSCCWRAEQLLTGRTALQLPSKLLQSMEGSNKPAAMWPTSLLSLLMQHHWGRCKAPTAWPVTSSVTLSLSVAT